MEEARNYGKIVHIKSISQNGRWEDAYPQWRTQDFFMGGGSVTSHRDDVKILHYNYSSLEVLKCIVL